MNAKILEIRDAGTFISVMATSMTSMVEEKSYYLRRAGYSVDGSTIMLVRLDDALAANDPYNWSSRVGRTMTEAHIYIAEKFFDLEDGDVVDVEFILGEKPQPKVTERATVRC